MAGIGKYIKRVRNEENGEKPFFCISAIFSLYIFLSLRGVTMSRRGNLVSCHLGHCAELVSGVFFCHCERLQGSVAISHCHPGHCVLFQDLFFFFTFFSNLGQLFIQSKCCLLSFWERIKVRVF